MGAFCLRVCASCEVLGHLSSEEHNVCRACTQHGTVTLRTWQQLLQDVHFVAQINVKLRDRDGPWRLKTAEGRHGVCIRPRKSRGNVACDFLLMFVSGGPPHRVRPCSLHGYRRRKISFLRLSPSSVEPGNFTVMEGTSSRKRNPR